MDHSDSESSSECHKIRNWDLSSGGGPKPFARLSSQLHKAETGWVSCEPSVFQDAENALGFLEWHSCESCSLSGLPQY